MKIMKKVLLVLVLVVIIAGIVMASIKGFNYGLLYSKTQRMNIYIDKEFDNKDIKEVAKEVLGNNVEVQYATHFGTITSIVAKEISDEQQDNIITKLNEKLETEINKEDDVIIMDIPQANFYEIISSYIAPVVIILAICLIYCAIRFRKQGIIKAIVIPCLISVLALAFYVSVFALARIPVNDLFIIFAMLIYILTLIFNTIRLERAEEK